MLKRKVVHIAMIVYCRYKIYAFKNISKHTLQRSKTQRAASAYICWSFTRRSTLCFSLSQIEIYVFIACCCNMLIFRCLIFLFPFSSFCAISLNFSFEM